MIYFLSAVRPLSKTLDTNGNTISTYPNVKNFSSIPYDINGVQPLYDLLLKHAALGHCLVKGELNKPLHNESRAGATTASTPTSWVCLDYDGLQLSTSIDNLIAPTTSRVVQLSARAGFCNQHQQRAHIFLWLSEPMLPAVLKQWLLGLNLSIPELAEQITLSANGLALRYPLDITTCQNDKLLFIAPPIVTGGEDPLPLHQRIKYIEASNSTFVVPISPNTCATLDTQRSELLTKLQKQAGLKPRAEKTKVIQNEEVCINPFPCLVTGIKTTNDFVYLNINNGDSWGYFFSIVNPYIVHNFKGETPTLLKDIDTTLYNQYIQSLSPTITNITPVVFREITTDTYYNALLDTTNSVVQLLSPVGSKDRLKDFMLQYGAQPIDNIEDWILEFNPAPSAKAFDIKQKTINLFSPTSYMTRASTLSIASTIVPSTIHKILSHLCVDRDTYNHFINWLAFIFQTRQQSCTAWLFQGCTGTGKGTLFHKILRPLLGPAFCHIALLRDFNEKFNGFLENKLLVFVDEANMDEGYDKTMNVLKNAITEPFIPIRHMRSVVTNKANYTNLIFSTNNIAALALASDDRRFNISPRQETPLQITSTEIANIERELMQFASYLQSYVVKENQVRTPLANTARDTIISLSRNSITCFFDAFLQGDINYFESMLCSSSTALRPEYLLAAAHLNRWRDEVDIGSKVPTKDLLDMYAAIIGTSIQIAKFSRMCALHNLKAQVIRVDNCTVRGFFTTFVRSQTHEQLNIANIL